MEYNVSKLFARAGGALIIAGLLLPWYKFDLVQLTGMLGATGGDLKISGFPTSKTFSAWESARTVFYIVGFFGVLALTQVPFATPGVVGRFFMVAGFAGFVLIGYKIFNPPLDFLSLLDMKLKPQPGIYLALAGMGLVTYGGWEQVKKDLAAPKFERAVGSDWQTTQNAGAANQGYAQSPAAAQAQALAQAQANAQLQPQVQPQQNAQQVAGQRVIPPDPFAPKPPQAG